MTWRAYALSLALVALATGLGALAGGHLAEPDLVMLYLLAIIVSAALAGRGASLLAAALSVLAYDFFLVPPHFTFSVSEQRHLLTFAMMFGVGLLISGLMLRIRAREARTAALYALSRDLASAVDQSAAMRATVGHAAEVLGGGAAALLDGDMQVQASQGALSLGEAERRAARWALEHDVPTGPGSDVLEDAPVTCVPLRAAQGALGVLVLPAAAEALGAEKRGFCEAFARQAALALERAHLAEEARTEELRSSLLSAVSHDLRTPLGAIIGAATTLRDDLGAVSARQRAELVEAICEEADRLERLVRNLLDMTRLESGAVTVKREWMPLEEIVGSALTRLEARLEGHPVVTDLPADLPLVSVDAVLIEQLFVNLLENAAKYTPAGTPIEISARAEGGALAVEVADRGPGLPAGGEERLFAKFVRGPHPGVPGAGLGLAICNGIARAHGGTLSAENRAGGGARFRARLPLVGTAPDMPLELEA